MNTALHFSSAKQDWATPDDFFHQLDCEFGFGLDAAASAENTKVPRAFLSAEQNALAVDWSGAFPSASSVFVNPPYGRGIGQWVQKAYEESQKGLTVVMLVPARTDTKWFHQWAVKGELRFVAGRLKFGGCTDAAPFPSLVIVFRPPFSGAGSYRWIAK